MKFKHNSLISSVTIRDDFKTLKSNRDWINATTPPNSYYKNNMKERLSFGRLDF